MAFQTAAHLDYLGAQVIYEDEHCCVWDSWLPKGKWEESRFSHKHEHNYWRVNVGFEGAHLSVPYVDTRTHQRGEFEITVDGPECLTMGKGLKENAYNQGTAAYRGILVEVCMCMYVLLADAGLLPAGDGAASAASTGV